MGAWCGRALVAPLYTRKQIQDPTEQNTSLEVCTGVRAQLQRHRRQAVTCTYADLARVRPACISFIRRINGRRATSLPIEWHGRSRGRIADVTGPRGIGARACLSAAHHAPREVLQELTCGVVSQPACDAVL